MPRFDLIADIVAPAPKLAKPARLEKDASDIGAQKNDFTAHLADDRQAEVNSSNEPQPTRDDQHAPDADANAATQPGDKTSGQPGDKTSGADKDARIKEAGADVAGDASVNPASAPVPVQNAAAALEAAFSLVGLQESGALSSDTALAITPDNAAADAPDALVAAPPADQTIAAPAQPLPVLAQAIAAQASVAPPPATLSTDAPADTETPVEAVTAAKPKTVAKPEALPAQDLGVPAGANRCGRRAC